MIDTIVGTKIHQTQTYTEAGDRIPVTVISAAPLKVVSVRTLDKNGYTAIEVAIGSRSAKNISKAVMGSLKKAGLDKNPPRFLREMRVAAITPEEAETLKPGSELKPVDILKPGDMIQVTGISKGKGFQGGVRRHHFKGGPRTHGQSDRERAPGSIGQTTTPGRVYKGKRMAGRMGNDKVTVKNLQVVSIDTDNNVMTIKGLVPGGRNSILMIQKMK